LKFLFARAPGAILTGVAIYEAVMDGV